MKKLNHIKKIYSKEYEENNMDIAELEKEFAKLGILIKNEDGTYKFVEEIMQDICLALRKIRQNESEQDYKIKKDYILNLLVGERLKNELM